MSKAEASSKQDPVQAEKRYAAGAAKNGVIQCVDIGGTLDSQFIGFH